MQRSTTRRITATFAGLALVASAAFAQPGGNGNGGNGNGGGGSGGLGSYIASLPLETLDAQELADLTFMREEEKVARDVYRVLHQAWGTPVFANIAASEQEHMDLTLLIFNRYGLADPLVSDATGDFSNPLLASVYQRLITLGQLSPMHGMLVGALIEDFDIFDLRAALLRTDNRDFRTVLQNLRRGSRNHMRAFWGQLDAMGVTFQGLRLSPLDILRIVSTPVETRPVDENGVPLP